MRFLILSLALLYSHSAVPCLHGFDPATVNSVGFSERRGKLVRRVELISGELAPGNSVSAVKIFLVPRGSQIDTYNLKDKSAAKDEATLREIRVIASKHLSRGARGGVRGKGLVRFFDGAKVVLTPYGSSFKDRDHIFTDIAKKHGIKSAHAARMDAQLARFVTFGYDVIVASIDTSKAKQAYRSRSKPSFAWEKAFTITQVKIGNRLT